MAHGEGTLFVQQDAAVSRALVQFLLRLVTLRDGAVGFLVAPVNTDGRLENLFVLLLLVGFWTFL